LNKELKDASSYLTQITHIGTKDYGLECQPRSYLDEECGISAILRFGLKTSKEKSQQEEEIIKENDLKNAYNNLGDESAKELNENPLNSKANQEGQELNHEENEVNNNLEEHEKDFIEDVTHLVNEFGKMCENDEKFELEDKIEKEIMFFENLITKLEQKYVEAFGDEKLNFGKESKKEELKKFKEEEELCEIEIYEGKVFCKCKNQNDDELL
jgi:hypothetical protein